MATDKQKQWRNRGQLLWRLKGIALRGLVSRAPLTDSERYSLAVAIANIDKVIDGFSKESKKLGFNIKERNK